jgi:Flp pilus assembly protein TadD
LLLCFLLLAATDFEVLLRQGLEALQRNNLPTAIVNLESAAKVQPTNPKVWLALAQTYRKSARKQSAESAVRKAESLGQKDPIILHGLAIYYKESDLAKAGEFESRYARLAPGDREAYSRAAAFFERAGDSKRAINELQEAIRSNPYQESYQFELAYILLAHQNFDAAITFLEASRRTFDKSPQIELALGVAYYGQRRFADAVDAFLRTAALAPEIQQPYIFLGRILQHGESRIQEITNKFAEFARANPGSYIAQFLYGKALNAQEKDAEALLRRSIALNDKFWESHFELALALEQKRDFAAASKELERAVALNPKDPTVHYRLARIYDRLGKSDAAAVERALHEKLTAEEKSAIEKHAAGLKRLEIVVK